MEKYNAIEVGERIKSIRRSLGITTEEFSKLFNPPASKGTISKWENGKYMPNNNRLKRIAELGNISVDELLYRSIEDSILNEINAFFDTQEDYELSNDGEKTVKEDTLQQSLRKPWIHKTYKGVYDEDEELFKSYVHDEINSAIMRLFNRTEYTNKGFIRYTTNGLDNLKRKLEDYSLNGIDNDLYKDTINIIETAKNNIFDLQDKHEID